MATGIAGPENSGVVVMASSRDVALTRSRPIFNPGSMQHLLMLAVIALFPFQVLGIDIGTTKIDLSVIVFAVFAIWAAASASRYGFGTGFKLFLFVYLAAETIMFMVGPTTPSRFASAFVWLTAVFLLHGARDHVPINAQAAFRVTLAGVALVAVALVYQYVIDRLDRPAGLMAEPSPAGMILLGSVAGLLISARWSPTGRGRRASYVGAFCLFGVSLITKTTHIVSFAIALVGVGALSRSFSVRTIFVVALLLGVVYWMVNYDPHYQSRTDIQGASSNLSLLSWLQGFDQMVTSLKAYPLIGGGLGATGQFDFYSPYTQDLFLAGYGDMNRQDAFSGLFRLTIELGPVLMAVVLYAIGLRLLHLWRASGDGSLPVGREAQAQMFLFTFAITLMVGILLKEPTYSRSHFVLAAMLFSVVPLRAVVRLPRSAAKQLHALGAARP